MSARPFQVGDHVRAAGMFEGEMQSGPIAVMHTIAAKDGVFEAFCAAYVLVDQGLPLEDAERMVQVLLTADATAPLDERNRIELIRTAPEDDGTEAESLAEVSVPAFPDVLVHGRQQVPA